MRWFIEFTFSGFWHFVGVALLLGGTANFILSAISRIRGCCTCESAEEESANNESQLKKEAVPND